MNRGTKENPIKCEKIVLRAWYTKREIKRWGGKKMVVEMLYDILNRYGNEDYFDFERFKE